jgi:hypothetical protein
LGIGDWVLGVGYRAKEFKTSEPRCLCGQDLQENSIFVENTPPENVMGGRFGSILGG